LFCLGRLLESLYVQLKYQVDRCVFSVLGSVTVVLEIVLTRKHKEYCKIQTKTYLVLRIMYWI